MNEGDRLGQVGNQQLFFRASHGLRMLKGAHEMKEAR